ncbi:MAG: DUF2344 domain-containing protein [Actinobacteria bacterium]|nr:DUF2344 domain-containing protein [Actinomycetota bacterium]
MKSSGPLRLRLQLIKKGRTRFLSHTEFMRTVMIVAKRARLPVQYGGKHRQKMKISFSPPLPVGFTSDCELVDIVIDDYVSPADAENSMLEMMPDGMGVSRCRLMGSESKPVGKLIDTAAYVIGLPEAYGDGEGWRMAARGFLEKPVVNFERVQPRRTRIVNIRKGVHNLDFRLRGDGDSVELYCVLDDGINGTVKPREIIEVLCDIAGVGFDVNDFTDINRAGLYMKKGNKLISPMDVDRRKPAV